MACVSPVNLCATCESLTTEQKRKPGILLCIGCQKYFCSQHIIQHRQSLSDALENGPVNERNMLQEKISTLHKQHWSTNITEQLEAINKWELDTIELIKQSAASARQQLQEVALVECDKLQKQFATLSDALNTLRENENYFENDIDELTSKLEHLKNGIEHFPIELQLNKISHELICVKSITQLASSLTPPCYLVDQLLKSQKPKLSVNLSAVKPGRMYPISDRLIAFHSQNELPTIDIDNNTWQSLCRLGEATELHWFNHLQLFLVLKCNDERYSINTLYQFDPKSGACTETLKKSTDWNHKSSGNVTTLTCFKQNILIVRQDKIEKWPVLNKEWYMSEDSHTCWRPPISCQLNDTIRCIRMNDLYYALIIEKANQNPQKLPAEFYFELKNHGMSTLHRIKTDYDYLPDKMRVLSLPNESGWLFFLGEKNKKYCYILDNDGKRYDQNTVLLSNVTDIAVHNNLILLRKTKQNSNSDVLDVYEWPR